MSAQSARKVDESEVDYRRRLEREKKATESNERQYRNAEYQPLLDAIADREAGNVQALLRDVLGRADLKSETASSSRIDDA